MRIAIIADGVVVNIIEADRDWDPGRGRVAIPSESAGPGDAWDGRTFTPVVSPDTGPTTAERYQAASNDAQRMVIVAEELGLTA